MTTSHVSALRVFRMNPRRCAHQVYSTRAPRSLASRSAILFSNPCCARLEKGRLLGSAHTLSVGAAACCASERPHALAVNNVAIPARAIAPERALLWKREYIEHSAFRRVLRQILHCCSEAECGG